MGTIQDKLNRLLDTKQQLKENLIVKGVDVSDDTPFSEYGNLINNISVELNKTSAVSVSGDTDVFTITFKDGTSISGSVSFDDSGMPVSMTDDQGDVATFADGFPDSVTDSEGNSVTILGG